MGDVEQSYFPLARLADDLLIVVFKHLVEVSPHSLRACTGVCHRFYRLALPIKYRDHVLIVNLDRVRQTSRLRNERSQLPLFVRSAVLDDRYSNGSDNAEPLIDFVRSAKNLKNITVYGSYQFSQRLLDEIRFRIPNCTIDYHAVFPDEEDGWYQGWRGSPLDWGMNGFSSSQLRTLKIDGIWRIHNGGPAVVKRSLEKIIKTCPNLQHFESWPQDWRDDGHILDLDLSSCDVLPTLEHLCYIPLSFDNLQTWNIVAGWGSLKVLRLVSVDNLSVFATFNLPQLRSLTISESAKAVAFNKLPAFRAPIQCLIITLDEDKLPYRFLRQFRDTLDELVVCRNRAKPDCGFSARKLRRLNKACPKLKRLCIRPYLDETSIVLPNNFLREVSRFHELQCLLLVIDYQRKLQVSPTLCFELYKSMKIHGPHSTISQLGIYLENRDTRYEDFESLINGASFLCSVTDCGVRNIEKQARYWDYGNYSRCCKEAQLKALEGRPFSKKFDYIWGERSEADIAWAAKQLGPGPEWAVKELLSQGLLKQRHLDDTWTPGNGNFIEEVEKAAISEKNLEELRSLMKEELIYWKNRLERQDKYGDYYCLYDILYPRSI